MLHASFRRNIIGKCICLAHEWKRSGCLKIEKRKKNNNMKFSSPNDMKLKQKKKNAHKILKLHVILQSELIYSNRYVLGMATHSTLTHI